MILLGLLLLSSCGYHLTGTGNIVPEGYKKLAVPVFFNATNQPYVDVEVTQAAIEEFLADGRLKIVSLEEADLVLHGKIIKYEVTPSSYTTFNGQTYVQQYRVNILVGASLEDLHTKKFIWNSSSIEATFISDYAVALGDIATTRIAKDAAIKKASRDIALALRSRILEGF